jgi:hypothetical protein
LAYLPSIAQAVRCWPVPGARYLTLAADPPGPSIPAELHPDLNLAVRSYARVQALPELIDYGGALDPGAPQLAGLFSPPRRPDFEATYQVHDWDWEGMRRGPEIASPEVTAVGLLARPGDLVHVPDSGYDIGSDQQVLVLYANAESVTLKYTREDNVVFGYTLHVDGICVAPGLLALYRRCDQAGRHVLPALAADQPYGWVVDTEVIVAIRDNGDFLDPRSRLDWWRAY